MFARDPIPADVNNHLCFLFSVLLMNNVVFVKVTSNLQCLPLFMRKYYMKLLVWKYGWILAQQCAKIGNVMTPTDFTIFGIENSVKKINCETNHSQWKLSEMGQYDILGLLNRVFQRNIYCWNISSINFFFFLCPILPDDDILLYYSLRVYAFTLLARRGKSCAV